MNIGAAESGLFFVGKEITQHNNNNSIDAELSFIKQKAFFFADFEFISAYSTFKSLSSSVGFKTALSNAGKDQLCESHPCQLVHK